MTGFKGCATLAIAAGLLGGCGSNEAETGEPAEGAESPGAETEAPAPEEAPAVTLSEEQRARVEEIAAQNTNGRFPSDAVTKDNAPIFLHLAATSDDESMILGALKAMASIYTHAERYADDKELVGDEYHPVVLRYLEHSSGAVVAAALDASKRSTMGETPNEEVATKVADMAANHPRAAGRLEALEALYNSREWLSADPSRYDLYVAALDAQEPWLVSSALFRLDSFSSSVADQEALKTKLIALVGHSDPGVRGRAADVLASVARNDEMKEEAIVAITPLLEDDDGFTKASAFDALARLGHLPALHAIIEQVEDPESCTYDIRYEELNGSSGRVHHDGSAWSTVGDAAMTAVRRMSRSVEGAEQFSYDVNYQQKDEDLAAAAEAAQAWYRTNRSNIPS